MKFKEWLVSKGYELKEDTSAEKMAEYYNEFNAMKQEELKKAIKDENAELISELKSELTNSQTEQLKSLNDTIKEMGLAIKNVSEKTKGDVSLLNLDTIEKGLEANKDELKSLYQDNKNGRVSFKAVGTMLISTNVSGGNVPVEQRLEGMNSIASRQIRLLDIVSRGTASSNVISWVYQANKEGAAGGTAEGALKNQIDFDLVVDQQSVKKRTAFIKISEEMVGDIDFMRSEINNELMRELLKDVENQVYQGDDLGSNLNGIRTVASAFTPGSFATGQPNAVDVPNSVDVLTVASNQILLAEKGMANYILMHPSDVTALKMVKVTATDRRYVERLALVAGNLSLDGITIIPTTLVTAGEYLIGAFDMAKVWDKGSISIEVGRDSDDFTKNLITVLAEWRGLCIVKNNDRASFVKGTFATDIAAITA